MEISDDEDTFHPNLDKGLNVRVNRITRDRKDEEIDAEQDKLKKDGKADKAAELEAKRPLHVGNACHVVEERTIIHSQDGSRKDRTKRGEESFSVDEFTMFKEDNKSVLDRFENADWETSRSLLLEHGGMLMDDYTNNYYMLTTLEEEMKGNRKRVERLCKQGQIISQIHQLAEPMKRPPRDLIPRFFERFEGDQSKAAFQEGVDHFKKHIISRAIQKKAEEEAEDAKAAAEAATTQVETTQEQPVPLVEAMHEMPLEQRMGPGGLDPVEVFAELPVELQDCFRSGDIDQLKKVAAGMDRAVFDNHFKRCIDAGLWSQG